MTEFGEPVRSRRNVARDTVNECPHEIEHFIVVDLRARPGWKKHDALNHAADVLCDASACVANSNAGVALMDRSSRFRSRWSVDDDTRDVGAVLDNEPGALPTWKEIMDKKRRACTEHAAGNSAGNTCKTSGTSEL
jgi:hypothetical protein